MSHPAPEGLQVKYINPLSRFEKISYEKEFDLMVILSGPEPQRSMLEEKLMKELKNFRGKILFVQGMLADKQTRTVSDKMVTRQFYAESRT
ncbi:MAG: hypothetical protein U5K51_01035 [Flavobacteriaceae bacterium]|nr:hypothetical protein [Flavobacteriaceae bacterium]